MLLLSPQTQYFPTKQMLFTDAFQLKLDAPKRLCQEWGILLSSKDSSFHFSIGWLSHLTEAFLEHLEDKEEKFLAVMDNVFCISKILGILYPESFPILSGRHLRLLNFHTESIV